MQIHLDVRSKKSIAIHWGTFALANEVIIIFDQIVTTDNLTFLNMYGNINFVLYTNTEDHEWRNPGIVINFGIKKATSTYCIITSPESILMPDAIHNLVINTNDTTFCVGSVIFMTYEKYNSYNINSSETTLSDLFKKPVNKNREEYIGPVYFGSIFMRKNGK